ncbi:hypothetical protein HPB50_012469 [Hyalomma asiaticum]|uniref:Uncharacterized protein n=1 Tax=Hyalomma asiaticum TaxID=266040 RepID=A0ACB7TN44_HYAAI|nr:hypothetical protein HPB50_012469 [Hyalomma asiaticum]
MGISLSIDLVARCLFESSVSTLSEDATFDEKPSFLSFVPHPEEAKDDDSNVSRDLDIKERSAYNRQRMPKMRGDVGVCVCGRCDFHRRAGFPRSHVEFLCETDVMRAQHAIQGAHYQSAVWSKDSEGLRINSGRKQRSYGAEPGSCRIFQIAEFGLFASADYSLTGCVLKALVHLGDVLPFAVIGADSNCDTGSLARRSSIPSDTVRAYLISDMALPYCVFLPLDLSTKYAIRTHGSLADRLHIWRTEAEILVCLSLLLWLWRLRVPSVLLVLAACACSSGRGWSSSLALEAAASGVFSLWFKSMECIGVAVDSGLRKVLPQQWKMEQAAIVVLTTMRRMTFASMLVSAAFLQRLWWAVVHWRRELWEAYLYHSDAISVHSGARGSPSTDLTEGGLLWHGGPCGS